LYCQQFDNPFIVSPLVGDMIDLEEREKYGLFADIRDFQSATIYKQLDGYYYLAINYLDKATGQERSTLLLRDEVAIQKIKMQIEYITRSKQTSEEPKTSLAEEDKARAGKGLLTHSRKFIVLNGGCIKGLGSDKAEWEKGYIIGAYTYYSLSSKIAIGCRWAFTHCDINRQYNLLPEIDEATRLDLSNYTFDHATGYRSMIEVLPSIRISLNRTPKTILSLQASVGMFFARAAQLEMQGHKWDDNIKSVVYVTSKGWNSTTTVDKFKYDDAGHYVNRIGTTFYGQQFIDSGHRGTRPGFVLGLSYNINNIIDIQPAFAFASQEIGDLFDMKNCYLSLSVGLIIPEEIITNPPKPVPQN